MIVKGRIIMYTILVVDDDADLRHLIKTYVENEGMSCDEADAGSAALVKIRQTQYDIIILDVIMPGQDGFSVLNEIRSLKSPAANTPVMMLTARKEEYDKLLGFKLGADDYVTKPFSPAVIIAWIKAMLRRVNGGDGRIVDDFMCFGSLEIKISKREVTIDGKIIQLRPKEFDLLVYFSRNSNTIVSREQLFKAVWDYKYYGDMRTVDTHIKTLRDRLQHCKEYIVTVWGIGYKFEYNN